MTCTCGEIMLDGEPYGCFSLNSDCELHGRESEWYNAPEQVERRRATVARSVELQLQALDARRNARESQAAEENLAAAPLVSDNTE